ncbi:MAG: hypothetical protein JSR36_00470 [Proteobacteria bacterium]|nr:hypothetical protein [Pseudomonadota bacterium]
MGLRVVLTVLLVWLPLLILAALRGSTALMGFLLDFSAHARFLVATPLLVAAEGWCLPWLTQVGWRFVSSGLIAEPDYPAFEATVKSTRRLMESRTVELLILVLAYVMVGGLLLRPVPRIVPWFSDTSAGHTTVTAAGWWAIGVSVPALLILTLGWAWRLFVWTRFLWRMNRLPLRLVAAHPDAAAGLRFLGVSLRAFAPLGFVIGVLVCGPMLNLAYHDALAPMHYKLTIAVTVGSVIAIFGLPLLVFTRRLSTVRRRGSFMYGMLAGAMGQQFERKWFAPDRTLQADALEQPDFSSTTDLYAIAANAYGMRAVPLVLMDIVPLAVATFLPFVPVALLSVPLDVILDRLAGLIL